MFETCRVLYPLEKGPSVSVYFAQNRKVPKHPRVFTLLAADPSLKDQRRQLERLFSFRSRLDHPGLIKVLGFAHRGRQLGLITEFLDYPRSQQIRPRFRSESHTLNWALQLAELIAFLHERDFVCGYLTPAQLYLRKGDQLVTNVLLEERKFQNSHSHPDWIRYASPEFLDTGCVNSNGDIFSMGMLFYWILTGSAPYAETESNLLREKHRFVDPVAPRKLNPDIPLEIDELILKMIAKDPSDRIRSAREVADVIRRYSGKHVEVEPRFQTSLVGRTQEVSFLREKIEECTREAKPLCLVISGISGIGKTTVIREGATTAELLGKQLIYVNHHPNQSLVDTFSSVSTPLDAQTDHIDIVERIHRGIRSSVNSGQMILFVDDLQWLDQASLQLYRELLVGESALPILMVAAVRTDELSDLWKALREELSFLRRLTEVRLNPLRRPEVRELTKSLLGRGVTGPFADQVYSQSEGNPFHCLELLRFMRDSGHLTFKEGSWHVESWCHENRVPHTLSDSIFQRFKRLSESASNVVMTLSMLEGPVQIEFLSRITEIASEQVDGVLNTLQMADFVVLDGTLRSQLVSLSHAWVGTAIRECLDEQLKKNLRRKIATALEDDYKTSKNPFVRKSLVYQLLLGDQSREAAEHLFNTLSWLQSSSLYKDAGKLGQLAWERGAVLKYDIALKRQIAEVLYMSGRLDECERFCLEALQNTSNVTRTERFQFHVVLGRVSLLKGKSRRAQHHLKRARVHLDNEKPGSVAEIEADLLVCYCRLGEFSRAKKHVSTILSRLKQGQETESAKLFHALCNFFHQNGDVTAAIRWEARAIQFALDQGSIVSALGRINNIAFFRVEQGSIERGERFAQWSLEAAENLENPELDLFAQATLCLLSRKKGIHKAVSRNLRRLLRVNQKANRNLHVEAELLIELAKNSNYLLLPEKALSYLGRCKTVLRQSQVHPSIADATITHGWTWLLLGRADRALKVVTSMNPRKIPRERGRYYLLLAAVQESLGNLDRAWKACCRAYDVTPRNMPYYVCRVRLAQARVQLARGKLRGVKKYVEDALSLAKEGFYLPFYAEAYLLRARYFLEQGHAGRSRVFCLRALQICSHCERPILEVEILQVLSRCETALGNKEKATQYLDDALGTVRKGLATISPAHRESFAERFLHSLESERRALVPTRPHAVPRYFIQLRQLADTLLTAESSSEAGGAILNAIVECFPAIAAVFWLVESDGTPRIVARRGHCLQTGRHFLIRQDDGSVSVNSSRLESPGQAGFAIWLGSRLTGLIYIEKQGGSISESEIDFLEFLARYVADRLAGQGEKEFQPQVGSALHVDGQPLIVGSHPRMLRLFEEIRRIAPARSTVLISGESGTGKELVARAIHGLSPRRKREFVAINCAGLPADLIESELFGYRKGSFTGAAADKAGLFEAACGGTLFLDEIASMPVDLQTRLLRVLQEKRVRRIGEFRERPVDFRVVSATNEQLEALLESGRFRHDLYHRLNVCQITVPALRERLSDVPELVAHLLGRLGRRVGETTRISAAAVDLLAGYSYPGNIRELENIIESAVHLCEDGLIRAEDVAGRLQRQREDAGSVSTVEAILQELASGRSDFWKAVRDPFLQRDLTRQQVREIVTAGLRACNGNYRDVVEYFNLPQSDYKKFLGFLANHDCKVDFRPFRKRKR